MPARSLLDRLLSPAGFGLALLFFLLPFVTVGCTDDTASPAVSYEGTFTGVDLLVGGAPDVVYTEDSGRPETLSGDEVDALLGQLGIQTPVQPLLVVAALTIFVSMLAGLLAPWHLRVRVGAAGSLAAIVLIVTEVLAVAPGVAAQNLADLRDDLGAGPHSTPALGFYLSVAALLAVAVREFLRARHRPPAPEPAEPA